MWYYLDPYIQRCFGLTGVEALDGLVGTWLLVLATVLIGDATVALVYRVNRAHLERLNRNLSKYGRLSQAALRHGDEVSYKALNRQANDAYGRVFFNNFGLSAASLWPVFFALDWMQPHFAEHGVRLPLVPSGVNYVVVFLVVYVATRWAVGRLKRRLPWFRRAEGRAPGGPGGGDEAA